MTIRRALLLVAGYAAVVGWLTWPLPAHLATHLPDTGVTRRYDSLVLGWALAQETRALPFDPALLTASSAYHPAWGALFYGEGGFGGLPLFAPTFRLTGNPVLALNVLFLGGVVLTATALHVVVRRWTGSDAAGFVAAWTFVAARWVLWRWVPCVPSYGVLWYVPFVVALLADECRGARHGPALAALVALQSLTSVYVAAAVIAPVAVLALWRLLRRDVAGGMRLSAVVAAALVVTAVAYSGSLVVRAHAPGLARQSVWYDPARRRMPVSELLVGFHSPLAMPLVVPGLLVAAGLALRPRPTAAAWRQCLLWALVGLALSPTPVLTLHQRPFVLPHALLAAWTPLYDVIRVPPRFGITTLLATAMLAGLGFAAIRDRLGGRRRAPSAALACAAALAMYVEYRHGRVLGGLAEVPMPRDYPLLAMPPPSPALLAALSRDQGPVLELPVGSLAGPDSFFDAELQARAMFDAIYHRRPVVNGYNGYWPDGFPARMALARRLPDPAALAALRRETGLATLLVRPKLFGVAERDACRLVGRYRPASRRCTARAGRDARRTWLALARSGGRSDLRFAGRYDHDLLFAVAPP